MYCICTAKSHIILAVLKHGSVRFMTRHYSSSSFFRQMPNALLERYFARAVLRANGVVRRIGLLGHEGGQTGCALLACCFRQLGDPVPATSSAADARHNQPGGSRDKQQQIREIWATGKYSSRDRCVEVECAELDMSISAARKALRNTPAPEPPT